MYYPFVFLQLQFTKNKTYMEEVLAPNKETFVAKEIFPLRESITAILEMIVAQTNVVRQPFVLQAKTKITIVNAAQLSQVYAFTVDAFDTIITNTDGKPLLFTVQKELLERQKKMP